MPILQLDPMFDAACDVKFKETSYVSPQTYSSTKANYSLQSEIAARFECGVSIADICETHALDFETACSLIQTNLISSYVRAPALEASRFRWLIAKLQVMRSNSRKGEILV